MRPPTGIREALTSRWRPLFARNRPSHEALRAPLSCSMSHAAAIAARRILQTFRERLLAGFSWSLMSTLSLQGSVLLTSVIVARLLGLEDFGIYALLVGTVMTVAGIAQGGTGLIATRFVGELLE